MTLVAGRDRRGTEAEDHRAAEKAGDTGTAGQEEEAVPTHNLSGRQVRCGGAHPLPILPLLDLAVAEQNTQGWCTKVNTSTNIAAAGLGLRGQEEMGAAGPGTREDRVKGKGEEGAGYGVGRSGAAGKSLDGRAGWSVLVSRAEALRPSQQLGVGRPRSETWLCDLDQSLCLSKPLFITCTVNTTQLG